MSRTVIDPKSVSCGMIGETMNGEKVVIRSTHHASECEDYKHYDVSQISKHITQDEWFALVVTDTDVVMCIYGESGVSCFSDTCFNTFNTPEFGVLYTINQTQHECDKFHIRVSNQYWIKMCDGGGLVYHKSNIFKSFFENENDAKIASTTLSEIYGKAFKVEFIDHVNIPFTNGFNIDISKSAPIETIMTSAIHYNDLRRMNDTRSLARNTKNGFVVCAHRHHNCYGLLYRMMSDVKLTLCEEGFLTNRNRFLTRCEAKKLALNIGQTTTDKMNSTTLTSEDLW